MSYSILQDGQLIATAAFRADAADIVKALDAYYNDEVRHAYASLIEFEFKEEK